MQSNSDKDDGDEVNIMASEHNGTSMDKKGIQKNLPFIYLFRRFERCFIGI